MRTARASDVVIVRYMFAWLTYEIDRLAQSERGKRARHAFRVGAVSGFMSAMREAQRRTDADRSAESKSVAIVLADRTELSKVLFMKDGTRFVSRRTYTTDAGAYGRGQEAGRNLSPRSGLNGGTTMPMLGQGR